MSLSFPLETLKLPREMMEAVNRANLTTSTILLSPLPRLADMMRCKIPFAQSLVAHVSRALAPSTSNVRAMYELEHVHAKGQEGSMADGRQGSGEGSVAGKSKGKGKGRDGGAYRAGWISTGDEGFDQCLGGGLRRGCLYEITGESAAGKSHLALTLALSAQLASLSSSPGGAIVLTSERELSTDRLVSLANSLLSTHEPEHHHDPTRVRDLLDNVLTNRVPDVDTLEHTLAYILPATLQGHRRASERTRARVARAVGSSGDASAGSQTLSLGQGSTRSYSVSSSTSTATSATTKSATASHASSRDTNPKAIRLIVLDSITALFRGGGATDEKPSAPSSLSLTERSKRLCSVADQLKALAVEYDLAILVINQVSDVFTRRVITPSPTSTPTSSFLHTQREPYSLANTGNERGEGGGGGEQPPMIYATQARYFSGQSDSLLKEASLGIVWANAVNVRIMLSRTGRRRLIHQDDLRVVKRRRKSHGDDGPHANDHSRGEDGVVSAAPSTGAADPMQRTTGNNDNNDTTIHPRLQWQPSTSASHTDLSGLEQDQDADVKPTLIRRMHLVFSPFARTSTVDYVITPSGMHSLSDTCTPVDSVQQAEKRKEGEDKRLAREIEEQRKQLGLLGDTGTYARAVDEVEQEQEEGDGEQDGDGDVFDDFGELPPEFWAEYADAATDAETRR